MLGAYIITMVRLLYGYIGATFYALGFWMDDIECFPTFVIGFEFVPLVTVYLLGIGVFWVYCFICAGLTWTSNLTFC